MTLDPEVRARACVLNHADPPPPSLVGSLINHSFLIWLNMSLILLKVQQASSLTCLSCGTRGLNSSDVTQPHHSQTVILWSSGAKECVMCFHTLLFSGCFSAPLFSRLTPSDVSFSLSSLTTSQRLSPLISNPRHSDQAPPASLKPAPFCSPIIFLLFYLAVLFLHHHLFPPGYANSEVAGPELQCCDSNRRSFLPRSCRDLSKLGGDGVKRFHFYGERLVEGLRCRAGERPELALFVYMMGETHHLVPKLK